MASTITDRKINGGLEGLARRLSEGFTVSVGIQGNEASQASGKRGTTLADLAAIHEYGLGGLPVRSWLRGWYDERETAIRAMIRTGYQKVIAGTVTAEVLAEGLGVHMVQEIQTRWTRPGAFQENAPSTIKAKGSSAPLIDTGRLRSAVTYIVNAGKRALAGGVSP